MQNGAGRKFILAEGPSRWLVSESTVETRKSSETGHVFQSKGFPYVTTLTLVYNFSESILMQCIGPLGPRGEKRD